MSVSQRKNNDGKKWMNFALRCLCKTFRCGPVTTNGNNLARKLICILIDVKLKHALIHSCDLSTQLG